MLIHQITACFFTYFVDVSATAAAAFVGTTVRQMSLRRTVSNHITDRRNMINLYNLLFTVSTYEYT